MLSRAEKAQVGLSMVFGMTEVMPSHKTFCFLEDMSFISDGHRSIY